jgi:mono/diheme cytochrome c family protein
MKTINAIAVIVVTAMFIGCGGGEQRDTAPGTAPQSMVKKEEPAGPDKGVGPITSIDLPETIDDALAATGKEVFEAKCTACHKVDKRFVGPALAGITERREPEWIMNMILDPERMVKENEAAKALLAEYLSPMANQSLTEDEARSILEYFRTL